LRVTTGGVLQQLTDYYPHRRPRIGIWQGYRRERPESEAAVSATIWDAHIIVRRLEPVDQRYRRLSLLATSQLTTAMHRAVLQQAREPVPEFISGHKPDNSPTDQPHLAYFPLAFVGSRFASGDLLGLAIGVPHDLSADQRRAALAAVGRVQELTLGSLGKWKLTSDDQGLANLQPDTWVASDPGSRCWATVTPVAFDQHAKVKDRVEREQALAAMIAQGCVRIGLPEPESVSLTPVSKHLGVPASHEFARLQRKDGSQRRHAHAILIFDQPMRGPIAIGAGRYRGYGFCRPLRERENFS